MMSRLKMRRRGFSLVEAVIALTFVLLVSIAAISIVFSAVRTNVKTFDKTRAQYFAENALEVFKASDSDAEFGKNLEFILPEDVTVEPTAYGEYTRFAYTSDESNFIALIDVEFESESGYHYFEISVFDKDSDSVVVSFDYRKGAIT